MTKKNYNSEKEGQIDFFDNFRIPWRDNNEILVNYTDGVYKGILFEFKLEIDNLNKVLFQAIKYLSKMRIKGESIPANIILVSLNTATIYLYKSQDYFEEIHHVYVGAASKNNNNFMANHYISKYNYMDMVDSNKIITLLKINEFIPIRLDENCIVGWAERYYRENPKATKGDFIGDHSGQIKIIGEIREPKHFKGLILSYKGKTNERFKYLMDKLNDRLKRKDLGAFYTPIPYANKALELVRMAIKQVPKGNNYIILDRCCGTGNLEAVLNEEELSHCILSTYEYYEYKVMVERLGDKVLAIIPPTEAQVEYANGCVLNADALTKEYIENPIIKPYINDKHYTIILYENPPYSQSAAISMREDGKPLKTFRKDSYVGTEFKKHLQNISETHNSSQELANLFIWSGFKYYLRQPTDSYIVFSPVKYFKNVHLIKRKFVKGFLFNRKYFHATDSAISCILWSNEYDDVENWALQPYDIDQNGQIKELEHSITINKCYSTISKYIKLNRKDSDIETNVVCKADGTPLVYDKEGGRRPIYNEDIIAYIFVNKFPIDAMSRELVRTNWNHGMSKGQGAWVRKEDYLYILPLFTAKLYPQDEWYEKDIYFTTSDGGDAYTKDLSFIKYCLIYTCLSNQNKCLSFYGSDGRYYQNELCFDNGKKHSSNNSKNPRNKKEYLPLALKDLNNITEKKGMYLNEDEKSLLSLWDKILNEAESTANYNNEWNYGVYQITKELNTSYKIDKNTICYDYPELNGDLITLRNNLKNYYKNYISPLMFKYKLIK